MYTQYIYIYLCRFIVKVIIAVYISLSFSFLGILDNLQARDATHQAKGTSHFAKYKEIQQNH